MRTPKDISGLSKEDQQHILKQREYQKQWRRKERLKMTQAEKAAHRERAQQWEKNWDLRNPGKKKEVVMRYINSPKGQATRKRNYQLECIRKKRGPKRVKASLEIQKIKRRIYQRRHYEKHPEAKAKRLRQDNDRRNAKRRTDETFRKNLNKRCLEWHLKNPEKVAKQMREYRKKRSAIDPMFRLLSALRTRVNAVLRGRSKSARTLELIGCTPEQLRVHIESQFTKGMAWDKIGRGNKGIQIDHIKPCCSFDLSDPKQQRLCFHWSNLRPLWGIDNLKKFTKSGPPIGQLPLLTMAA